jgi:hypothetical protein
MAQPAGGWGLGGAEHHWQQGQGTTAGTVGQHKITKPFNLQKLNEYSYTHRANCHHGHRCRNGCTALSFSRYSDSKPVSMASQLLAPF